MKDPDHAADRPQGDEATARPLCARPRLTLTLLGLFVAWIALLVALKLATN